MHLIIRHTTPFSVFALLTLGTAANATTYLPNSATINTLRHDQDIITGYSNYNDYNNRTNGTSPTVNLVSGASLSSTTSVSVGSGSIFNISGGSIGPGLNPSYPQVTALDTSTVNFTGGKIFDNLDAYDNSTVNISGGQVKFVSSFYNGTVNFSGGDVHLLSAYGSSTINFTAGHIQTSPNVYQDGTLDFFGTGLSVTAAYPNYNTAFSYYYLAGKLTDGTDITGLPVIVQNGVTARVKFNGITVITSTPEPGNAAFLVGIVTVGISIFRKRRK